MPTYVEIAVNIPQVSAVFHYHLPAELEGLVQPGHLVAVPFRQQMVYGVVLRQVEQPEVPETRPVLELVDPAAVITHQQIELVKHLSEATLAPLAACIGLMLPPGLMQQADAVYSLTPFGLEIATNPAGELSSTQVRLLGLLNKRGPLRGQQIDRALPRANWRSSVRPLIRQGLIVSE
ncbi:MAG: priA, partial [Chloroflexi bacterium]|nr:priA [Chloroflexota bacterium]